MFIYCKHCGDRIDSEAAICPSCGARTDKGRKAVTAKLWVWIPLVLGAAVILVVALNLGRWLSSPKKEAPLPEPEPMPIVQTAATTEAMGAETVSPAEPTVLFAQDGVAISAFGVEETNAGLALKLEVENRSDRDIILTGDDFVVNGVTLSGSLFIKAGAGKTVHDALNFYTSTLETAGIQSIATIRAVDTVIKDPDTYDSLCKVEFEYVTELGRDFVQRIDRSGILLYEDGDFIIIAKDLKQDFMGRTLVLLVENHRDSDLFIEAMNLTVNGIPAGCLMFDRVCGNTAAFCELRIFESDLEENGIENIHILTFDLETLDAETYELITCLQGISIMNP